MKVEWRTILGAAVFLGATGVVYWAFGLTTAGPTGLVIVFAVADAVLGMALGLFAQIGLVACRGPEGDAVPAHEGRHLRLAQHPQRELADEIALAQRLTLAERVPRH